VVCDGRGGELGAGRGVEVVGVVLSAGAVDGGVVFVLEVSAGRLELHSFPTRRSSDLVVGVAGRAVQREGAGVDGDLAFVVEVALDGRVTGVDYIHGGGDYQGAG